MARSKANPKAEKPKPRGSRDYRMSEAALLEARYLWELQGVDESGRRYTQVRACKEAGITAQGYLYHRLNNTKLWQKVDKRFGALVTDSGLLDMARRATERILRRGADTPAATLAGKLLDLAASKTEGTRSVRLVIEQFGEGDRGVQEDNGDSTDGDETKQS